MKILALETSTEYCSVALWQDGTVIEHCERVGQKHSEVLIAMIDELLRAAGHKLQTMNGIAFGKGPGSFTGVRIACGVAQGLALGADVPTFGVCTLEALAEASGQPQVIAVLDARMDEVYHAAYRKQEDGWQAVSEPCVCRPEAAPMLTGARWHGAGSGFDTHGALLQHRYRGQLHSIDAAAVPLAGAIARLAADGFRRGLGVDVAQALPLYLRDKVALKTHEREAAKP